MVGSCLSDWYFCYFVWVRKGFLYPVLVPSHVNIHKHFCIKGNSTLLPLFIFLLNFLVACQVKNLIFFLCPLSLSFDNTWSIENYKNNEKL